MRTVSDPSLLVGEIDRVLRLIQKPPINMQFYLKHADSFPPIDVMDQDWDNLIILDACRLDYFESQNEIEGELSAKLSAGGESWEFMEQNFARRQFHDTIYVTANPHVDRIPDGTFFNIENLSHYWDPDVEVVLPEDVVNVAVGAHDQYPDKRLIIHFMQPHTPWLGPAAEEIRSNFDVRGTNKDHGKKMLGYDVPDSRTGDVGWFELVRRGELSHQTMRNAYSETLEIVLNHTNQLLQELSGKSVITADHGEMLGERIGLSRWWGHYNNFWTDSLRFVPWLEIKYDQRRKVTEDSPESRERMDEEMIRDRLQALGYQ